MSLADDEIGDVVELGRLAVEDDEPRAVASWPCSGKSGRRPDHERRADREKQIAGQRQRFGAPHRRLRHRLAEGDRRRLDVAAAVRAVRRLPVRPSKSFRDPARARSAGRNRGRSRRWCCRAARPRRPASNARGLVQIVDVLRDHRRRLAGPIEAGERQMAARPAALSKTAPPWRTAAARTSSRISWLAMNSSNGIGWYLGPEAAGRAEIRNAAFGGDAGAGERHDRARACDQVAQALSAVSRSGANRAIWP